MALQRKQAPVGNGGAKALVKDVKVLSIAAFATIGGLLYGLNLGIFSSVLSMPAFQARMGEWDPADPHADQYKKGWLVSIFECGAWLGTLCAGSIAEVMSRKYGIFIGASIFITGVVIQSTSVAIGHMAILFGRCISGIGVGVLSAIVPLYNSECAPAEVRGSLVGLQQLSINFGIMISYWIGYGTNYIGGTTAQTQSNAAWLVPILLQLIPAVILLVGMVFMPFSPRWLIHRGRELEARRVLAQLRGLPSDHELIELEFLEIKAQSMFEKRSVSEKFPQLQNQTTLSTVKLQFVAIKSLFSTTGMLKRVIVGTFIQFFQQWTGINAVLYYAPTIFKQLGLSSNTTSLLATGVVGFVLFAATIPAVLWIDRVGRKPVLITGSIGMVACHIVIAGLLGYYKTDITHHPAAGWAAIAMVWLFIINFAYSWGPCGWIILSEIWPLSARPYGVALGASSNWINNVFVNQATPSMLSSIGYGAFIIFGSVTLLSAAFVFFVVPETKRLTLEQMDVVFGSEGAAQADLKRMQDINMEIGLVTSRS